jgi:hypothetical protein
MIAIASPSVRHLLLPSRANGRSFPRMHGFRNSEANAGGNGGNSLYSRPSQ